MAPGKMSDVQRWTVSFAIVIAAVAASYEWIDRPIAFFAHDQTHQFQIFARLTEIPELIAPLAGLTLLLLGMRGLTRRPLSKPQSVLLLCSLSLIVAGSVKTQLKYVFGRTWPETWVHNNPSLIHDGVYGFNPFHGGRGFDSFPSGHTAAVCAVISVLWLCYPKLRPLYAVCVLAVSIGLIGADFHFLSDIIAGGFIGVSTGWMLLRIWETAQATPALQQDH